MNSDVLFSAAVIITSKDWYDLCPKRTAHKTTTEAEAPVVAAAVATGADSTGWNTIPRIATPSTILLMKRLPEEPVPPDPPPPRCRSLGASGASSISQCSGSSSSLSASSSNSSALRFRLLLPPRFFFLVAGGAPGALLCVVGPCGPALLRRSGTSQYATSSQSASLPHVGHFGRSPGIENLSDEHSSHIQRVLAHASVGLSFEHL